VARTQFDQSSLANLLEGYVESYIEKLSRPVQAHPFRALGYAFVVGALLATRPGRVLALGLLKGKSVMGPV
jgi:hypothetical protein